jgi:hypothetical protein
MPSIRYTRIEVTPEAYRALEAEAILQGKTLKKLASELIMKGVSRKALEFVQGAAVPHETIIDFSDPTIAKAINSIGTTRIHINEDLLATIQNILPDDGYQGAMLYVAQHTASAERDELHRVLTILERYKLSTGLAAEIIKNLNTIGSPEVNNKAI